MSKASSTLRFDLVNNQMIFLPAGNAKFTMVDVEDIGKVAAAILINAMIHRNKIYELTCFKKLTFREMADDLSIVLGIYIVYKSPDLFTFYWRKRNEKYHRALYL